MGRVTRDEKYRREGMERALRIAKDKGINGLEAELRLRGIINVPCGIGLESINRMKADMNQKIMNSFLILAAATLHDEFEFEQAKLDRFLTRMNEKAECMSEDYCTWDDQIKMLQEETGISFEK